MHIRTNVWITFIAVSLFASPSFAQQASDSLRTDIEKIQASTDPGFWRDFVPGTHEFSKSGAFVVTATGATTVSYGALTEIAMKAYGIKVPTLALARLYLDFKYNFPKLAMKMISPQSALYARLAARAAALDRLIARQAAVSGGLRWIETRWGFRLLMFGGGGLVTATGFTLMSMISETADKAQDEMGEAFYDGHLALNSVFTAGQSAEAIYQLAQRHEGLAAQIQVFALMISELQSVN